MLRLAEDLVAAVAPSEPLATFIALAERHRAKAATEAYDFSDVLQPLSGADQRRIWEAVQQRTEAVVQQALMRAQDDSEDAADGDADDEDDELALVFMEAVSDLALAAVSTDKPAVCDPFFRTVQLLHDMIFLLDDSGEHLQDNIARVCETWWKSELEGKEDLIINTVCFLLIKSLSDRSTGLLVKRVYSLRTALHLFDFSDPAADDLRAYLRRCLSHPTYLKVEEGRRFLSFLFGIDANFIADLYFVLRTQIAQASKSTCELYGEILFRAWKNASGDLVQRLEQDVLQDLMYRAVHSRKAAPGPGLRRLLGYFHGQKRQRGVDEMLARLYEPIIWRALKVANPQVRANAASLLFDAFPLHNPEATRSETDEILQQHFDVMGELLMDKDMGVRCVGVQGVCRVLNIFWEMIPLGTTTALLEVLVNELAWDTSAPAVRSSVCHGLRYLLDNALALPAMKLVLPRLANMIHDTSDRVRCDFLDLLLAVKGIRQIKFWQVVPLEHLVCRLETDRHPIATRVTALLINSYFPETKSEAEQVKRCLALIKTGRRAARKFYLHAHKFVSETSMVLLASALVRHVQASIEAGEQDADSLGGALEVAAVLLDAYKKKRKTATGEEASALAEIAASLEELVGALSWDTLSVAAMLRIAKNLPKSSVEALTASWTSKLCTELQTAEDTMAAPRLDCLCAWGKGPELLRLAAASLTQQQVDGNQRKKPRKDKAGDENMPASLSREAALRLLDLALVNTQSRDAMLSSGQKSALASIMSALNTEASVELDLYGRLCIHLQARDMAISGHDLGHLVHLVHSFADEKLGSQPAHGAKGKGKARARAGGDGGATGLDIVAAGLELLSEAIALGLSTDELRSAVAVMCADLAERGAARKMLAGFARAVYQLQTHGSDSTSLACKLLSYRDANARGITRKESAALRVLLQHLLLHTQRCGDAASLTDALVGAATGADEAQCLGEALRAVRLEDSACAALSGSVRAAEEGATDSARVAAVLHVSRAAGVLAKPEMQQALQRLRGTAVAEDDSVAAILDDAVSAEPAAAAVC